MAKRKFYFKDVLVEHNKRYGYSIRKISVYYLAKNGQPHLIDQFYYNTGSTPGAKQEIVNYLTSHRYSKGYFIPSKYHGKKYYDDGIYKIYQIFEMF